MRTEDLGSDGFYLLAVHKSRDISYGTLVVWEVFLFVLWVVFFLLVLSSCV